MDTTKSLPSVLHARKAESRLVLVRGIATPAYWEDWCTRQSCKFDCSICKRTRMRYCDNFGHNLANSQTSQTKFANAKRKFMVNTYVTAWRGWTNVSPDFKRSLPTDDARFCSNTTPRKSAHSVLKKKESHAKISFYRTASARRKENSHIRASHITPNKATNAAGSRAALISKFLEDSALNLCRHSLKNSRNVR